MNKVQIGGVLLMAFAALVAGLFIGAYYSEPIMTSIVDSQSIQISELNDFINDYKNTTKTQMKEINGLEIRVDQLELCYKTYDDTGITTYKDVDKLLKCIGKVER